MGVTVLVVASVLMVAAFLLGLHVASGLGLLSMSLMLLFSDRPLWDIFAIAAWNTNTSFVLVAIPLFILMGEVLLRAGTSARLYSTMSLWLRGMPGGLLHSNIATCAMFAAVSGSSVATAATIGSVALPEFRARGYDERLVLGSLAAGGTLGILIPPSISFIVYGVLMEVSIGQLYMAGIIPGIMLSASFMAIIFVAALLRPEWAPAEETVSWSVRLRSLVNILPALALVFLVLGTIYLGIATATEAAAFGVVGSLLLAAIERKVNAAMLKETFCATARTTSMVMLILTAAFVLNSMLALLGVPQAISRTVVSWGLGPIETVLALVVFYLVLGTFMDGFAMMVTTIPVILPILKAANVDLVWFGVIAVILTEAALISPPEGMNLYVVHGMRAPGNGRERSIMDVYVGVLPFFLMMLVAIALLIIFPSIALWLPNSMKGT